MSRYQVLWPTPSERGDLALPKKSFFWGKPVISWRESFNTYIGGARKKVEVIWSSEVRDRVHYRSQNHYFRATISEPETDNVPKHSADHFGGVPVVSIVL